MRWTAVGRTRTSQPQAIWKSDKGVERALREQATLLVVDNMESILLPPFMAEETPEALTEDARRELEAILALCERLLKAGETRIVFTSREALPAPFDAQRNRRELHRLSREDAVKLVERVLNAAGGDGGTSAETREEIEALVESVNGHARTLALLAPSLQARGAKATRESLVELMAEMEKKFPGSREKSVFASVELSLQRMTEANRERARVLGVFHGGVQLGLLRVMMEWEEADVNSLARELVRDRAGDAEPLQPPHAQPRALPLPARPVGRGGTRDADCPLGRGDARVCRVSSPATEPEHRNRSDADRPGTAEPVCPARPRAACGGCRRRRSIWPLRSTACCKCSASRGCWSVWGRSRCCGGALGETWNHARFEAARTRIEQQLAGGRLREAFEGAQGLLQRARAAGGQAYPVADYDLAMAYFTLARVLKTAGGSEQALPLLDEARQRFEAVAKERAEKAAERMVSACITEQGDCLGTWAGSTKRRQPTKSVSAATNNEVITAVSLLAKVQLGSVRMNQRRYPEALAAYAEARERFTHWMNRAPSP